MMCAQPYCIWAVTLVCGLVTVLERFTSMAEKCGRQCAAYITSGAAGDAHVVRVGRSSVPKHCSPFPDCCDLVGGIAGLVLLGDPAVGSV
jgi:hypothetical protein